MARWVDEIDLERSVEEAFEFIAGLVARCFFSDVESATCAASANGGRLKAFAKISEGRRLLVPGSSISEAAGGQQVRARHGPQLKRKEKLYDEHGHR